MPHAALTLGRWAVSPGMQTVMIPEATKLFSVGFEADRLFVFGTCRPDAPLTGYQIAVVGTGEPVPPAKSFYIGSASVGDRTWHVYNCLPADD